MARTNRILEILLAARQTAENSWWESNLDASGGASTFQTEPLTGTFPAFAVLDTPQMALWVGRLCSLASLSPPSWLTMNTTQRATWLHENLWKVSAIASVWCAVDNPQLPAWRQCVPSDAIDDWQGCSEITVSPTAPQLVIVGNSIPFGSGCDDANNNLTRHLQRLLPPGWLVRNFALAGDNTEAMIAAFASTIAPLYDAARQHNALWFHEGTNSINNGDSGPTAFAATETYCGMADAVGFDVFAGDIIANDNPGLRVGYQADRSSYNGSFAGGVSGAFRTLRLSSLAPFQDPHNALYYAPTLPPAHTVPDLVHPNDYGSGYYAQVLRALLASAYSF